MALTAQNITVMVSLRFDTVNSSTIKLACFHDFCTGLTHYRSEFLHCVRASSFCIKAFSRNYEITVISSTIYSKAGLFLLCTNTFLASLTVNAFTAKLERIYTK